MYKITGKTYEAREQLKAAGYKWDGKDWVGSSREPFDAMIAKWRKPGYSMFFDKLSLKINIEEFSVATCEV